MMNPSPGAFILDAANAAEQVVVGLSHLKYQYRIKDLAATVSLAANFFSRAGKEVNENSTFFKGNFEEMFVKFTQKCTSNFEIILTALEKARSYKKGFGDFREDACEMAEPPKEPWERLLWGLGMSEREADNFETEVERLAEGSEVLLNVVSLVVLQKIAQRRELTPSERTFLAEMKKNMKKILCGLRDTEIASLMSFSLQEHTRAANMVQVTKKGKTEGKENTLTDDASSSATLCDPKEDSAECKGCLNKKQLDSKDKPTATEKETPAVEKEVIYEMYRAYNGPFKVKCKQTIFRLFGMPLSKTHHNEHEVAPHLNKVPISQDEIKEYMRTAEVANPALKSSNVEKILNLPRIVNVTIYNMINSKNDIRGFKRHNWSIECVTPINEAKKPGFWERKAKKDGIDHQGYIIIICGERQDYPGPPGPPLPAGPRIVMLKEKKRFDWATKPIAKIELTQQETENVVNDFLAGFSTLYDGVLVQDRGVALRSILLEEEDLDSDSDDSSSYCSSRSLVDD